MRRRYPFYSAALSGFFGTLLVMTPTAGRAQDAVALVRAGDHAMTCEALAAEINALARPAPVAAKPKKRRGGLFGALGSAMAFVPVVGPAAMLAQAAAGTAASAAAQAETRAETEQMQAAARDAMAGPGIEEQRRDRLSTIFADKRC